MSSIARSFAAPFLGLALTLAMPAFAQEAQKVAGTVVSMVPLDGMTPAQGFSGFGDETTQASVVVSELPAEAHAQIAPLFADQTAATTAFAAQGVTVTDLNQLATDAGAEFPLIIGTQAMGGVTYDKWIALFGGDRTVLVTVQAPEGAGVEKDAVEAMLKSVTLGDEASLEEKLSALPFSVEPAEPFRVVDTIAGSGVLMTAGPLDVDPDGTQPLLIVASQISQPVSPDLLEQVAETLLGQTRGLEAADVTTKEAVEFAGTDGVLLGGTAMENGMERRFVQYLAIGEDGRFVRLIAIAKADAFDDVQPAIETIAASIALTD